MPSLPVSPTEFETLGYKLMIGDNEKALKRCKRTMKERFSSWFGTGSIVVALTWCRLHFSGWLSKTHDVSRPVHLLWALLFLQTYATEPTLAAQVGGVDKKTFQKWAWFYLEGVANLASKVVS